MKAIRDSIIYILGDAVAKSVPFLLLPLLSRYLGVSGFGELSYYQVIIALSIILMGFSLDGSLTRYYYRYGKNLLGLLICIGFGHIVAITLIFCVIVFFFSDDYILWYSIFVGATQSVLSIFFAVQQCQRKPGVYIIVQIVNAMVSGVLTYALIKYLSSTPEMRIIAMLFANIVSLMCSISIVFLYQKQKVTIKRNSIRLLYKYDIAFGLPLLLHQFSFFAKGQADRLLIVKVFDTTTLGVYSAGYQLASVFTIIFMAINKALIPYFFDGLKNGKTRNVDIRKWTLLSFVLVPFPCVLVWIVPQSIYDSFLGPGFHDAKYYCVIFTIAISLTIPYLILVNYLFFCSKNKAIAFCTLSSSVVYLLLVFMLSFFDVEYIPFAMIISNLIALLLLYSVVHKMNKDC